MRVSAVIFAGLLLLSGAAQAATLVETGSMARTDVPTGGLSTTISVDKFDVSGATLTGIQVMFSGQTYGSVTIARGFSFDGNTKTFNNVRLRQDFSLTIAPSVTASLNNVQTSAASLAVPWWSSRTAATETPRDAAFTAGSSSLGSPVSVAPSLFSLFTGPGSISMALSILRDNTSPTAPSGANPYTVSYDNEAIAQVQITYIYTESTTPTTVPAPMSLALFGMGLLGLGGVVRRRTRA